MTNYQYEAVVTSSQDQTPVTHLTPQQSHLIYAALKLAEESGEVVQLLQRVIMRRESPGVGWLDQLEMELGDVLWAVTAIANTCGLNLEGIQKKAVERLQERYPDGYNSKSFSSAKKDGHK